MVRNHKGAFITFESTKEGIGKTTQALLLYERLNSAGYDVVLTKNPGGTEFGQKIRELLLHSSFKLSKATELFLFMADRAQHYKEVLKPALKEGKIVICDRYFDSTLVYQGSGAGWKTAFLYRLHHASTGSLFPDLTIVLDGTPYRELSQEDRFERLGGEHHKKLERSMLHLATKENRYVILNANQSQEELANKIIELVRTRGLLGEQ